MSEALSKISAVKINNILMQYLKINAKIHCEQNKHFLAKTGLALLIFFFASGFSMALQDTVIYPIFIPNVDILFCTQLVFFWYYLDVLNLWSSDLEPSSFIL